MPTLCIHYIVYILRTLYSTIPSDTSILLLMMSIVRVRSKLLIEWITINLRFYRIKHITYIFLVVYFEPSSYVGDNGIG